MSIGPHLSHGLADKSEQLVAELLVAPASFEAVIVASGAFVATSGAIVATTGVAAAASGCTPVGGGLTAAQVAFSGDTFTGITDATGCDVGIYIGPGVTDVTIGDSTPGDTTIEHANGAGILAERASNLTIRDSTVTGNGVAPPAVAQAFGISLFGVSSSTVTGNTVTDNGRGGIGLMDDGPFDPVRS